MVDLVVVFVVFMIITLLLVPELMKAYTKMQAELAEIKHKRELEEREHMTLMLKNQEEEIRLLRERN